MYRTFLFIAALAAALFCVVSSAFDPDPEEYGILEQAALRNNSHNLVIGWRQYGDSLLFKHSVNERYSFGKILSKDVQFPEKGKRNNATITFILVRDLSNGSGYANITSGGVGDENVKIKIKSKRSRGLHFKVEIYGQ